MVETAEERQPDVKPPSPTVKLTLRIPRSWNEALTEAATTQGLTVSALIRLVLGGFLRNRLGGAGA